MEPFLPVLYSHSTLPSAYPPSRSQAVLPFHLYYAWLVKYFDDDFRDAAQKSLVRIKEIAIEEGQFEIENAPVYPNYAPPDTPLERMYGGNVLALKRLKAVVDPENVMGLSGGFRF